MGKTISKDLEDFNSKVVPNIGTMKSKVSEINSKVEAVVTANKTAIQAIDSYYSSSNKANIVNALNFSTETYTGVTEATTHLTTILDKCDKLKTKIDELNDKIKAIDKKYETKKEKEDIINSTTASDEDKDKAKTEKQTIEDEISTAETDFDNALKEAEDLLAEIKGLDSGMNKFVDSKFSISAQGAREDAKNGGSTSLDFGTFLGGTYKYYKDPLTGMEGYLYVPQYADSNAKIPLTVYIGGSGEVGSRTNGAGLAQMLQEGAIQPKGAVFVVTVPGLRSFVSNADGFHEKLINTVINIAEQNNVDTKRISLSGHSFGAEACYVLMEKNPGFFSACVPISGSYSVDFSTIKGTKVRAIHSPSDNTEGSEVSYDKATSRISQMQQVGVDAQLYSINGGHNIQRKAYEEIILEDENGNPISTIDWLQSQRRA